MVRMSAAVVLIRSRGCAPGKPRWVKYSVNLMVWFFMHQFQRLDQRLFLTRCEQPGQQHGLRLPDLRSRLRRAIRLCRVSCFLASMTQQIHSLRASGVKSSHLARAVTSARRTSSRSEGTSWTTPVAIFVTDMGVLPLRWEGACSLFEPVLTSPWFGPL